MFCFSTVGWNLNFKFIYFNWIFILVHFGLFHYVFLWNCEAKFLSISGYNKHLRNKHKDIKKTKVVKRNLYTCNDCNENFYLKKTLIQHVKTHLMKNVQRHSLCSLCSKSFSSMAGLIAHLQSIHNVNIESKLLHFDNIEGKLI